MIRHFTNSNIKLIKNKKPDFVYFSPPGVSGPSGLMLAVYDKDNCFVVNFSKNKEEGYTNLLKEILENIPEFQLLTQIHKYNPKRENFEGLDYMYLGCGNVTLIQPEIYVKNEINNFYSFSKYVKSLNNGDLHRILMKNHV